MMAEKCGILFSIVLFFSVLVNCRVLNKGDLYRLDIVHYNDFHDRFEETSVPYPICKNNDSSCLGGFARLYHEVQTLLQEKPGALLLNAGDTFQGTYWYTLLKWDIIQKFINMLPNDAHALGNHEFDDGIAGLVPYLKAMKAPVLAANMNASLEPTMKGLFQSHLVLEKNGRKIGIIGLITPDTKYSSNTQEVLFTDPFETTKREAQLLTDQGVDIIIVLSHCGLNVDINIARKVGQHVDIIIGGHSHSLLWNGESPSKEPISGPYPVVVGTEGKSQHKVLVVTASAMSKYLGNLTTYFDKNGELQSFDGEPVFLNRSIPEDAEIKALLQPYKLKLHTYVSEVVGYSPEDLRAEICGSKECFIGDLAADAYVNATKKLKLSNKPHVGFLLRNMIRGSIPKGDITRGSVINALPFTNKVVTFSLQGKYLKEALERTTTSAWNRKPFEGPWLPQLSGARVTLNVTSGRADPIMILEDGVYQPLDLEKEYQIVTFGFLAKGGNEFTMFNNHKNQTVIGVDAHLLEKYIKKLSPLRPALDNRLTVIED